MDIALNVQYGRDDQLIFAQQLGVEQVVMTVENYGEEVLAMAKNRVEKSALKLAGLEGLVLADVEAASAVVRAAGAVGIGLVSVGQTAVDAREPVGRGEAMAGRRSGPAVNASAVASVLTAANEAGVQLALAGDVPGAGVDLDLAELGGTDPVAIINGYGDRLLMVRVGNVSADREAFLNEGEIDLPSTLLALKRVGFVGPVRAGLPPGMVGDTEWGHKGRAYDLGYLKAVLQAIASL